MYTSKSTFSRFVVGVISLLLLTGCTLPSITPESAPSSSNVEATAPQSATGQPATGQDITVNVAAMARLGETTQIKIEQFVETPSAGYETAAVIEDAVVIDEIVDLLDAPLALQPQATCVESYRLLFTLENGTVHTFNYLCAGTAENILRGDVPFLADGDVRPPERLQEIIEQQLAAQ